jgi:cation diffusion facilitator family transporter
MPRIQHLAFGSLVVSLIVLAVKYYAYALTGSVALYSDALESVINVATAGATVIAISISAHPPDANHPYGHHKAEYLSAVIEGVLIVLAALGIFRAAYFGFLNPKSIDAPVIGLVMTSGATMINAAWSWVLIREGRRHRSPALIADGQHLVTDVVTSAGVAIGVVFVVVTKWAVLDSALAALVALHVLWTGWAVTKESVAGLMDEALPEATLLRIRQLISAAAEGAIEVHDLRTRQAGRMTFIEFHLVVPGAMSVAEAHDICDRLERILRAEVKDALITIHVEPDSKAKHRGILVA